MLAKIDNFRQLDERKKLGEVLTRRGRLAAGRRWARRESGRAAAPATKGRSPVLFQGANPVDRYQRLSIEPLTAESTEIRSKESMLTDDVKASKIGRGKEVEETKANKLQQLKSQIPFSTNEIIRSSNISSLFSPSLCTLVRPMVFGPSGCHI